MFFLGTGLMIAAAVGAVVMATTEIGAGYLVIALGIAMIGFALQISGALIERSKMKFLIKMARLQAEQNIRVLKTLKEARDGKSEE